ncbi:hypothetical protein CRE_03498 [Caenorhabditis remanei]|uniref:Uncharacterized protein n=1 Tax=Caenorhabditis remanei TaxID=31234 RepID=E3NK33_CAERE|nr:hypothetical protein CRE_03498 [Caenorhabditis remanei]
MLLSKQKTKKLFGPGGNELSTLEEAVRSRRHSIIHSPTFYHVCRKTLGNWLCGSLHGVPADEAHKLGSGRSPTPSPPTTAALEKPNFKGKRTLSGIHVDKVVSFLLFLLLSYTKFDTGPPSLKGVISASLSSTVHTG